jgi:mono/diheme cytochrome c family protein
MGRFLLGIVIGLLLAPAALLAWFRFGHPPVAVSDAPLFEERLVTKIPLHARIDGEAPRVAPIADNEVNLVEGAEVYREQCASCHGFHGKSSPFGAHMFPAAPPLWEKHGDRDVVGVSDDPVGETYWKVANGIRLTGMPAYKDLLTDTQLWQVALLLSDANKPLPPAALDSVSVRPPASGPQSSTAGAPTKKR